MEKTTKKCVYTESGPAYLQINGGHLPSPTAQKPHETPIPKPHNAQIVNAQTLFQAFSQTLMALMAPVGGH